MISEHQFVTHYLSAWRSITPLADGYWALENLLLDRVSSPISTEAPKALRGIINETAFRAFCILQKQNKKKMNAEAVNAAVESCVAESINYVTRFSPAIAIDEDDFDHRCKNEAFLLSRRLLQFFSTGQSTLLRPTFDGCGIISACEGDLVQDSCLYEIKAGDRNFRVADLRQLLIYSALAYANGKLSFTDVGLFNPRTGLYWRKNLEDLSRSLSGLSLIDTLSALVEQFSSASVSR